MKAVLLVSMLLTWAVSACARPASAPDAHASLSLEPRDGVDHALLWTREIDHDTSVLEDKLGFTVTTGGTFPNNVANRLAVFSDETYLELLHFTVPLEQVSSSDSRGLDFLAERDGSVGFGIRTDNLDAAAARVAAAGLELDGLSPGDYDPDGSDGPLTAAAIKYRTFGFKNAPISGLDPFFVWYAPRTTATGEGQPRRDARTAHANTALRLSSVWILTADPVASSTALSRMGFSRGERIGMPIIGGAATVFTGSRGAILLVEPRGRGVAATALQSRGPHVLGVSVEVSDLQLAQAITGRGYGRLPQIYGGPFGSAVLAPTQDDLGLFIEFHAGGTASARL